MGELFDYALRLVARKRQQPGDDAISRLLAENLSDEEDWPTAFWGDHYARLLRVKRRYDPDGLFRVHHGVPHAC